MLDIPEAAGALTETTKRSKVRYHSEAYQEAVRHRFLAADYRVFIVEGIQS